MKTKNVFDLGDFVVHLSKQLGFRALSFKRMSRYSFLQNIQTGTKLKRFQPRS